jgi:ADP-ribose pyrophosphatase YjhB (NUDIX family)
MAAARGNLSRGMAFRCYGNKGVTTAFSTSRAYASVKCSSRNYGKFQMVSRQNTQAYQSTASGAHNIANSGPRSRVRHHPSFGTQRQMRQPFHSSTTLHDTPLDTEAVKQTGDEEWTQVLPYEKGSHGAVHIRIPERNETGDESSVVDASNDPYDAATFMTRLEVTVEAAKQIGSASVWVDVPMSRASLIEAMTHGDNLKFEFHHAQGQIASLFLWLKEEVECKIPEYATHQVGVGGLVINDADPEQTTLLCVREMRNNYMPWKLPGGLAELGEQIDEAAIREVLEETGIKCRFEHILGVRHTHNTQFGRSDLYFVCLLKPIPVSSRTNGDEETIIPDPVPQADEIADTAWVPMAEYRDMVNGKMPDLKKGHPMMQYMLKLYDVSQQSAVGAIQRTTLTSIIPGRRPSPIYHAAIPTNGSPPQSDSTAKKS